MNHNSISERYFKPEQRSASQTFGLSLRSLVFRVKTLWLPLPSNNAPVLQLPQDIILYILQFLTIVDGVNLTQVCEALRRHASSHSYWFTVLNANKWRTPLACGNHTELSDLSTEELRALCHRAACVRRTFKSSAPAIRLKHISAFSLPEGYYFLCPPIPGTSLVVMNNLTRADSHAVLWDFQTRTTVGEKLPTISPTRKASDLREGKDGVSFCVWAGDFYESTALITSYKLTLLYVRYPTKDESASLVEKKSFLVPWHFPIFTYTAAIAHNQEILVALCPERSIQRFSFLVYSLTSDSAEYQAIHTELPYLGIKNVVAELVGEELVILIAEKDHSRVYRYPASVLKVSSNGPDSSPPKLELPPPINLPQSHRNTSAFHPIWPHLLIAPTHVTEVCVNEQNTTLSLLNLSTELYHDIATRPPYNENVALHSSVSKRAFVFFQPLNRQIQLVQYDPEEGIVSFHDLELPYGPRHPLGHMFKPENLTWSIRVDDARGEILIIQAPAQAFFRLSYI